MAISGVKTWYRIRAARKSAEIRIYEEIGAWGITAQQFANDLDALGELTTLTVRINSPGGDVFEAIAIHNALQRHPARITVYIDGLCASAATLVALAGDETRMAENGRYMIHEPWTVSGGDATDLQRSAELLDSIAGQLVAMYAKKTGLEPADIRERMKAETWMTAAEALDAGFIDAIDEPLRVAAKMHDLSRFHHAPGATMSETPTDVPNPPADPEPVPDTPNPPAAPEPVPETLDPVAIAQVCLDANEPTLIPILLAGPVNAATLRTRIDNATEVRRLCAIAKRPEAAAHYIAAGLTPDQAKLRLWDSIATADRAVGEIDTTPPDDPPPPTDPTTIARAALRYQQEQQTIGLKISFAEAVAHVSKQGIPA